jgi:DNA mismatch repair ATPase MutS
LQTLRAVVETDGLAASKRIKILQRWMELLDSSDHILMRVAGPLLLWRQQLAAAVEAWRRGNGPRVGAWVRTLAELEALSSMGTLAFEKPEWAFPELVASGALFEAEDLRHPLLGASVSVPNDLELGLEQRLLIVSGSNMSGKSTLLRAVGLNTVLAWSGAPVAATRLRTSRLRIGASIRVTDSLQDNKSRFFAEISRLRQIVDLTKSGDAVLFLLDELLSGTNSHDRRIGAAGIVRGLLRANSIGLLTTHDLALTQLDQEAPLMIGNVHFEDRISATGVEFDYRLLPGIVTHSNALELMRSIGLEI